MKKKIEKGKKSELLTTVQSWHTGPDGYQGKAEPCGRPGATQAALGSREENSARHLSTSATRANRSTSAGSNTRQTSLVRTEATTPMRQAFT